MGGGIIFILELLKTYGPFKNNLDYLVLNVVIEGKSLWICITA